MEICVEGRHKADIRVLYQKVNKLRYEIDAKIDSIDISSDQATINKLTASAKALFESYSNALLTFNAEIQTQPMEYQDDWNAKSKKLVQYEATMKSRFQKILHLRTQGFRKSNGHSHHKDEDSSDPSATELKGLVEEKEGLEQSRRIAIEIQGYGNLVWNSIKQQSGRLRDVFVRTDQMNDGIDVSHTMASSLSRKTRSDCYMFIGLSILTIVLIVVCFYYVRPWLFS